MQLTIDLKDGANCWWVRHLGVPNHQRVWSWIWTEYCHDWWCEMVLILHPTWDDYPQWQTYVCFCGLKPLSNIWNISTYPTVSHYIPENIGTSNPQNTVLVWRLVILYDAPQSSWSGFKLAELKLGKFAASNYVHTYNHIYLYIHIIICTYGSGW